MIKLIAPRVGANRFVLVEGFIVGPYASDDQADRNEPISEFRSNWDSLHGTKGICHENFVEHREAYGTICFEPAHLACVPHPVHDSTYDSPDNTYFYTSKSGYVTATRGLAVDGIVAHNRISSNYYHYGFESNSADGKAFTIYEATASGTNPKLLALCKWEYLLTAETSTVATFHRVYQSYLLPGGGLPGPWGYADRDVITIDTLKNLTTTLKQGSKTLSTANYTVRVPYYATLPWFSPHAVRLAAEVITTRMLAESFPFPIDDVSYGDLAMRASEKVNANKVNMLEFLSDLRDPKAMIPKLSNLKTLKGISSNILAADFGLMPTIDDVKSIVAACRRVRPYLDSEGRETYTSASIKSAAVGQYRYQLEQRLKLAIDKEDSELDALISKVESVGFLPTLENVWDLIPYSFLVDWLIDVGGLLERLDTRARLTRLNIHYVTMSRKEQIEYDLVWSELLPFTGSIKMVLYHRWVSDQCPTPPLSLHTTFEGFDHWIDAAALLLQRKK